MNPLIVGLEDQKGCFWTGPIHQFTGVHRSQVFVLPLVQLWRVRGGSVEVKLLERLKDQVHFHLLSLLFRS